MKGKWYIGIDPGKTGGIVVLSNNGKLISKHLVPTVGKDIDVNEFANIFIKIIKDAEVTGVNLHAGVEEVHAIFGSAASATFSFGRCVGLIDGIIRALNIPSSKIQPKVWQKEIWESSEIEREPDKVTIRRGKEVKVKGKVKTKIVSLKAFKRLFPEIDLRTSNRQKNQPDGLVDAILLAEYCRRKNY